MPGKMVNIYKELIDLKIIDDVCTQVNTITSTCGPLQKLAVEVLSAIVHPYYGEVYSFPWKRGPHSAVLEYNENIGNFDMLRETVYHCLNDFNWTGKLAVVYKDNFENDSVACICAFRIVLQMLRVKIDSVSTVLSDSEMMKLLHHALESSNIV